MADRPALHVPVNPVRFVTAASLFDGHDAAINIMRRLLQSQGAEVVHLGHDRSVQEVVTAVLQEDAQGVAISSYQGGHVEYFGYLAKELAARGAGHVKIYGGGGGVIVADEIRELHDYGVARIYSPEDGQKLGLQGMINEVVAMCDVDLAKDAPGDGAAAIAALNSSDRFTRVRTLARTISALEAGHAGANLRQAIAAAAAKSKAPVLGITGTGGAGKSSLTDELLQRFVRSFPDRRIAVIAMDPTRRRSGGALLGDRIRMNALAAPNVFMRSLATRREHMATSAVLREVIGLCGAAGFELVLVETAGIGQSDSEIADLADIPVYVMTSEYGAASQLEKIDMLDYAELVVLNKFEKRGAEDALRDVRKQWRRNHPADLRRGDEELPVFPTIASRFNDPGVNRLYAALLERLDAKVTGGASWTVADGRPVDPGPTTFHGHDPLIPSQRTRYLAEIAEICKRNNVMVLTDEIFTWRGNRHYVRLDPTDGPAHILVGVSP